MFHCPICRAPLLPGEGRFFCENGHCYDLAKEGYLYLLPPNKKHSKAPGDTREMVAARRAFLETGSYGLFRRELVRLVKKHSPRSGPLAILDVGCGEGYYTGALKECLPGSAVAGIDIAKCAVRAASKKYKGISFAVASCFDLPVADGAMDVAVNIFAPIVPEELLRVLRPGGILLLAVPGPRHLFGLKQLAYDAPYENEKKDTAYEGFTLLERTAVEDALHLENGKDIENLFSMTPYYWKTGVEGCARVRSAASLQTPVSFHFLVYQKNLTL